MSKVRDFSIGDTTVPAEHRGSYLAFADAGILPGVLQRIPEEGEFGLPVVRAPLAAVEMAAGMAADVVALEFRQPDFAEAQDRFVLVLREADIGAAAFFMRRLILSALGLLKQEGAGEEIGEMRAGALGHGAALLPQQIVVGAVEGDDDELLALGRLDRVILGKGRACGKRGGEGEEEKSRQHGYPRQFAKGLSSIPNAAIL